jgi:hypothetical protein
LRLFVRKNSPNKLGLIDQYYTEWLPDRKKKSAWVFVEKGVKFDYPNFPERF